MNPIVVQNLSRHFGAFKAVSDVSFHVERGEIFGYLGANGAGKSTTLRMLCGLLAPSSGDAVVAGHAIRRSSERAIEAGRATVALIVPRGVERDVERGRPTSVQAILDGSDPNESNTAQSTIARYFDGVSQRLGAERNERAGIAPRGEAVSLRPRVFYNPRLDTPTFMLPGILAVMLLINTALLTAVGVAREKETGTLEQVLLPFHRCC